MTSSSGPTPSGEVPTGTVNDCLQIPAVAPGTYTLELLGTRFSSLLATPPDVVPVGVTLTLTPTSGRPGSLVSVSGSNPTGVPPELQQGLISACWGGCAGGLTIGLAPTWSADGHFSGSFRVPTDPWVGRDGVEAVRPGEIAVGIECVRMVLSPGCVNHDDATATFRVIGQEPTRCTTVEACATLTVTPASVQPGGTVQASGWLPTSEPLQPQDRFKLVWATESATPSLTRDVSVNPGTAAFLLATETITVRAGPAWGDLSDTRPALIQTSAVGNLQSDPANPSDLARCSGTAILISRSDGSAWQRVPVNRAAEVPAGSGCEGAWIDRDHPGSVWVAGTAPTSPDGTQSGFVGSYTTDGGREWRPVPVPAGRRASDFGGVRVDGDNVQALFSAASYEFPAAPPVVVTTRDGGRSWRAGALSCPPVGPCVTLGPAVPSACGKGLGSQNILFSADSGRSWQEVSNPSALANECSAAYLVTLRSGQVVLLTGGGFQTRSSIVSEDGGSTWAFLSVPTTAPGPDSGSGEPLVPDSLPLPDGRLLGFGISGGSNLLLPVGATSWCTEIGARLEAPGYGQRYEVVGNKLWWIESTAAGTQARSVALSALSC